MCSGCSAQLFCCLIVAQADLPDMVAKVGRLCNCKAGPAGAVSGYLAYGTSMDYLYVHKRVPYPLTVEVYGGDNIGKLAPGESNKAVDAWPTVTKSGTPTTASAQFQRRRLQQQHSMAQQEGGSIAQHSVGQGLGRRLMTWALQQLQAAGSGDAQPSTTQQQGDLQQQPHQQQRRRQRLSRRKRRRHRLQQVKSFATAVESGDGSTLALLPNGEAPATGLADAGSTSQRSMAAGGGFSAGGDLEQLKQQARQQQQQQQPASAGAAGTLSIPVQLGGLQSQQGTAGAQQQQQDGDTILALLTSATPPQRNCFTAFNPVNEAEYRRVVADWLAASLIMMKHMMDGKEGQQMIARVASGAALHRGSTSNEQHSGATVRERSSLLPDSSSSSTAAAGRGLRRLTQPA
jgi:hypothetical protein